MVHTESGRGAAVWTLEGLAGELEPLLDSAVREMGIPGASVALVKPDREVLLHRGVTNIEHPLPVDTLTYYRIASVTKTFTALAAVVVLASKGVPLDAPVSEVLGLRQLSMGATSADVTFEHLLTHTAGWDGDFAYAAVDFERLGRGDGAVDRLVDTIAAARQLTAPGELWHYNNSAFWVLDLALQRLTGQRYEDVVRASVLAPLGLSGASFAAEDIITRRVCAGHMERAGVLVRSEPWGWPGPAAVASGGLAATVEHMVAWTRWWLRTGQGTGDGDPAVADMLTVRAPAGSVCDRMALGWMVDDVDGMRVFKHGGSGAGQQCRVSFAPELGLGLVVLANSHRGHLLESSVRTHLLGRLVGYAPAWEQPAQPLPDGIREELPGAYASTTNRFRIDLCGGIPLLTETASRAALQGRSAPPAPAAAVELIHVGNGRFVASTGPFQGVRLDVIRRSGRPLPDVRWRGRLCERQ